MLLVDLDPPEALANDLTPGTGGIAYQPAAEAAVWILFYARSLADLGLTPGRVPQAEEGQRARHLPVPEDSYVRAAGSEEWSAQPVDASAAFARLRLPGVSPVDCALRLGCFLDLAEGECSTPCPTPTAPAPPRFLEVPEAPQIACRPGWSELELSPAAAPARRYRACAAFSSTVSECPVGQYRVPGAAACSAVGAACPGGDGFRADLPGETTFVRAGAAGGDGSRARPFGTIAEALAALGGAGATVALAPGRYLEDVALPAELLLAGACATETVIAGTIALGAGSSTVADLSLEVPPAHAVTLGDAAQLRLRGLILGGGDAAVRVGHQSRLEISGALATNALSLMLEAGARATLWAVELRSGSAITAEPTASAHLEDVRLASLVASGGVVTAAGLALEGPAPALQLTGGSLMLDGAQLTATDAQGPLAVLDRATLQLSHTYAVAAGPLLDVGPAATASVSDAYLRSRSSDGPVIAVIDGALSASRVVLDAAARGIYAAESPGSSSPPRLELTAFAFFGGDTIGIDVQDRGTLIAHRLLIEEHEGLGLFVGDGRNDGSIDADLEDLRLAGVAGALEVGGGRRVHLARFQVERSTAAGLHVIAAVLAAPTVEAVDADIAGPRAPSGECPQGLECGAAIAVEGGLVSLRGFLLRDASQGLATTVAGGVALADGRLLDLGVGIAAFGAGTDLAPLMERVRFERVARGCDPCGR